LLFYTMWLELSTGGHVKLKRRCMEFKYEKSVFIFRRDLRIDDNTGLINALEQSATVIPCFIFDPRQITDKNDYRSMNAIQFMMESLADLEKQFKARKGRLYIFYGNPDDVIKKLIKTEKIEAVFCNRDYTPFSAKRDESMKKICLKHGVDFHSDEDLLLHNPYEITTANGTPYQIFTPFFRRASQFPVRKPEKVRSTSFYTKPISLTGVSKKYSSTLSYTNKNIHVHGGRSNAEKILATLKMFKEYKKTRDYPSLATTNLSAYLKFGCVSPREVYYAIKKKLGPDSLLIQQINWRDFFTYVAYFSPFVFGHPFYQKYEKIRWSKSKKMFNLWCEGKTGFPIVDAGMRQLNQTGFMHNRVRMIVGSFLVKDLHINWLWGERYFAQHLSDYDPCVNNGNWQWVASTGSDRQPYFRIFNPWRQQKKFDPDCTYIKEWVPELKDVEPKIIHTLFKPTVSVSGYSKPIVNHDAQAKKAKAMYKV